MHRRPRSMHHLPRVDAQSLAAMAVVLLVTALEARADRQPHAGMMRYPDVSATQIVFAYANDLWLAPRTGGVATPLASPPGSEAFPRFSADGRTVAFVGNYDGNRDLYTIPITGGVPTRVTHHPTGETLCDWTPDGKLLFFASGYAGMARVQQLLQVAAEGGMPDKLPVPYGTVAAISPDGTWLAYTPHTTDNRTWKRYLGGMATDIWLFNLRDASARKITDWAGTDSQPMWHGTMLYYMSDDGPEHQLNIWSYDPASGRRAQLTHFADFDVKWPAIGPGPDGGGEIVFQHGADLKLLDLRTNAVRTVEITVPGDLPTIRPRLFDVRGRIENWHVSPSGQRVVFEARGDIWTAPARHGSPRNLTRTSGAAERDPAWSPDGRWIAYFSDATGEYELYITQSDGKGETRQLTLVAIESPGIEPSEPPPSPPGSPVAPPAFRSSPLWSPDSKHIVFGDKSGAIYIYTLESKELRRIDQDPRAEIPALTPSWSHDSRWIAYARNGDNMQSAIWLYHVPTAARHQVTSGMFNDTWPTFDRKGKYLFFATNRRFSEPIYEDIGSAFVYTGTDLLAVVPLRDRLASPWAPKSDEETWEKDEKSTEPKTKPADKDDGEDDEKSGDEDDDSDDEGDEDKGDEDDGGDAARSETEAPARATSAAIQDDPAATAPTSEPASQPATDEAAKADEPKPFEIDLVGFESRAILVPVKPGAFTNLAVNDEDKLLYVRRPVRGLNDDEEEGGRTPLLLLDLADEEHEEKTVLDNVDGYVLTADGKKLLARSGDTFAVVESRPGQKLDKAVPLDNMLVTIDPRAEWRQLVLEAWRLQRDFFYVPNMHGVDWPAMREHYLAMLGDCVSRADVGYIIRELISELNIGHAYYWGADVDEPGRAVGLLGVDFAREAGAYRIANILRGGPWDLDARGPLAQPGVNVKEGDYLLAVNGVPVDPARDPWAALAGHAPGQVVTLTVSDQPTLKPATQPTGEDPGSRVEERGSRESDEAASASRDPQSSILNPQSSPANDETDKKAKDDAAKDKDKDGKDDKDDKDKDEPELTRTGQRDIVVKLISAEDEQRLRYRAWVEHNRAYVDGQTAGRVGYIHVPDTGVNGQNELFRQFYGQRHKPALIIDERWNGGGQIPHRFIELLNRPLTNYWARRDGPAWPSPHDAHAGPKCMLINGLAGSGGDAFPYYFRQAKLGKLIGMRTWGGLVGISGNPSLIDGAVVTVPTFGFFELDGTWGVEGRGVAPDIEVIDDPSLMVTGADPQLDAGIRHMLAELERHPPAAPKVPTPPDRKGMGVPESDW